MKKDKLLDIELERRVDLYLSGRLDHDAIDELWADLIADEEAFDYLKTAANLKQVVEERESRRPVIHFLGGRVQSWSAYAAAAVVLIVIGSALFFNTFTQEPAVEPIASIELDYYRSTDGTFNGGSGDEAVREAIILANSGQYEAAINRLDEELEKTEDADVRAVLNINAGSIMYNIGEYKEAIVRFSNVVEADEGSVVLHERAWWYLGNSYFQLNRVEDARVAFQSALDLNGAYSRIAQSYLRALAVSE